jgi:hypothetical protein
VNLLPGFGPAVSGVNGTNTGLAVLAAAAVALLLFGHRWALVFPAGYALSQGLWAVYISAAAALQSSPQSQFSPVQLRTSPGPGMLVPAIGVAISLRACWSDLRSTAGKLFPRLQTKQKPISQAEADEPGTRVLGSI